MSETGGGAAAEFATGARLGGRYVLRRRIAAGGMGQVWEALDELLGRQVAVKTPFIGLASDAEFRSRFEAEARTTARLSHPGIAQVYDVGEQDSVPFLVMELVHGEPLSAVLALEGRLSADRTLDIVAQTAAALQAAHQLGIVHRDVKPPNVLVTPAGQVKVTDFGIARAADGEALTRTGTMLGSAPYLSPEQALGRPATSASDIYALGIVAYECLAGHRLFTADAPAAVALAHVQERPEPLPADVPPGVRALVEQCLAKSPEERPDAAELAQRAQALRPGASASVAAAPESAGERTAVMAPLDDTRLAPVLRDERPPVAPAPVTALRPFAPDPLRRRWQPTAVGVVGALLLIALVGVLVHLFQVAQREPTTPAGRPSGSASASSSARAASASATPIVINAADFVGMSYLRARQRLRSLGFVATSDPAVAGSSLAPVTGVSPVGPQPAGATITLTVDRAAAPRPSATATRRPSSRPTATTTSAPSVTTPTVTGTPAGLSADATAAAATSPSGTSQDHEPVKPKKHGRLLFDSPPTKDAR